MEAILYVVHGTRVKKGIEEASSCVQKLMNQLPTPIQEMAFLEFQHPTMEEAFERMIEKGATMIYVFPLLLFAAGHAKKDIPIIIEKMKKRYPFVTIEYTGAFGVCRELVEIIVERIKQAPIQENEKTAYLLVGRGSTDKEAYHDFLEMKQQIAHTVQLPITECFLAARTPTVEETVQQAKEQGYTQIVLVPYLLFSGRLLTRLQRIQQIETCPVVVCHPIGYHPNLITFFQRYFKKAS